MKILEHEFFNGSKEKVRTLCLEAFDKKTEGLSDEGKKAARKRMEDELQISEDCGYWYFYYLHYNIAAKAREWKDLVLIQGNAEYTYLAYLLDITTVDAFRMDYPVEMCLEYSHDMIPYLCIMAPEGLRAKLVAYLEELFGEDLVHEDECTICLGDKDVDDEDRYLEDIMVGFLEDPLLSRVNVVIDHSAETLEYIYKEVLLPIYPTGEIKDDDIDVERIKEGIGLYTVNDRGISGAGYFDGTYGGLMEALAVHMGYFFDRPGLRDDDGNLICTRDDFLRLGRELFDSEKEAYKFMSDVRKGKFSRRLEFLLRWSEKGVPDDILNELMLVGYIVSEGRIIPTAQLLLYLVAHASKDKEEQEEGDGSEVTHSVAESVVYVTEQQLMDFADEVLDDYDKAFEELGK